MPADRATLRAAQFPADAPALRALIEEYLVWLACDLTYQHVDAELAHLATVYGEPHGFMLVAHSEGQMVGCAGMKRIDAVTGEMKRLYVKPTFQRRGCGADLVAAVVARAHASGIERLLLDAAPPTVNAQALYLRAGFREIAAYYDSPLAGTRYFEKWLANMPDRQD